jgi:hypothetical protein
LELPGPDEPTERFLTENFLPVSRRPEALAGYGAFMVALAVFDAAEGKRVSTMPVTDDLEALHEAGYGIGARTLNRHGGLQRIQLFLGYHPDGYNPTRKELLRRFKWIADNGYAADDLGEPGTWDVADVIEWGAARDLTPAYNRTYRILDGDTSPLRDMLMVEARRFPRPPFLDLFRFGARVLAEHGRPLSQKELNETYSDEFNGLPYNTIKHAFGTYTKFWLEFDRVPTSSGLTAQDIANLGVRWRIKNGGRELHFGIISDLSKQALFPSKQPINRYFPGGIDKYSQAIEPGYQRYLSLRDELSDRGVTPEVCKLACQKFEDSDEFVQRIRNNSRILEALSSDTPGAEFIRNLVKNGFNLLEESRYDFQQWYLEKAFSQLELTGKGEKRFILELIPRVDPDEFLN